MPNLVTVKVGANGRVNLYNSQGYTHVIADVVGYYTGAPDRPAAACSPPSRRAVCSTPASAPAGRLAGPVGAGQSIDVDGHRVGGVPATGVSGVALNVTVDQPTAAGFLTVVADRRAAAARVDPQLRARPDGRQPRARQGRRGRPGQHLQLVRRHARRRRRRRLLLGDRRRVRAGQPATRSSTAASASARGSPGPLGQGQSVSIVALGGIGPVPPGATAAIVNVTSVDSIDPVVRHRLADRRRQADGVDAEPAAGRARAQPGLPEARHRRPAVAVQQLRLDRLIVDVFGYIMYWTP